MGRPSMRAYISTTGDMATVSMMRLYAIPGRDASAGKAEIPQGLPCGSPWGFAFQFSSCQLASCQFPALWLLQVKPVEVHHLGPGGDEGVDEFFFGVGGGVDLGEGAELRVGAEDEVDAGGGPLRLSGLAVYRCV